MLALQSSSVGEQRSAGFGVIELMIAMTLSLLLLSGVIALFASSRKSYESNEHLGRIQENGRFALDMIQRDLRSAGYLGCAKQTPFANTLDTTSNLMLWDFQFALQGFESTGTTWAPALDATLVPSAAAVNSDVLVVRTPDPDSRAKRVTALMGTSSADLSVAPAAPEYPDGQTVMVTDCSAVSVFEVTDDNGAGVIKHTSPGAVSGVAAGQLASAGNSTADLGYAFTPGSTVLPVNTVVYYVRASGVAGNGNSLWRRVGRDAPEELVEGVDSLQLLYGVDTDGNRVVDGDYVKADAVTDWGGVVSVRLGLLVRSLEQYGNTPDTEHVVLGETIAAAGDNRERLRFSTTVALRNEAL
jgi:type IV pilus assembly protein PilW